LKPSFGRVPNLARPNAFLYTPFIQNGPITRTVRDAAQMLNVMAGSHDGDPFSLPDHPLGFLDATERGIEGLRIAYSPKLDVFPIDPAIAAVVRDAVDGFHDAGAQVDEIEIGMPGSHDELLTGWLRGAAIMYAELAEFFKLGGIADFLGTDRDAIPPELVEWIESGKSMSAVDGKLDDAFRTEVFDALQNNCFANYDVLITPMTAINSIENVADGRTVGPSEVDGVSVNPLVGWTLGFPFNMSGHPAASIPAGFTPDGLPVGLQIVGRRHDDETVIAASAAFEEARPWAASYHELESARA